MAKSSRAAKAPTLKIILASSSPRRIGFLRDLGLNARVLPPEIDETVRPGELPRALVRRLASTKARSVAETVGLAVPGTIVLAADTIVVLGKRILNKPRDAREARAMLRSLAGRRHEVLTGYCLISAEKTLIRVVSSKVTIARLSRRAIENYVATGEPLDKAGAYGAQGKGMALIERLEGSYANVVGLPVSHVLKDLAQSFGFELFSWL